MSSLKSADVSFSPFGYAEPGEVFESNNSSNQYKITDAKGGIIYWTKLDYDARVPKSELKGSCSLP